MKKTIVLLSALLLGLTALSGCAEKETLAPDVPTEGVGFSQDAEEAAPAPAAAAAAKDPSTIDVDLTKMSATMVYSEVYNMMALPDNYLGQTVRMNGQFQVYEGDGRNYYVVLIADAMACCQQGMEFVLGGDASYPEDYPDPGTEVTVTGVFDTYMEGEYMRYCQLIDATMTY